MDVRYFPGSAVRPGDVLLGGKVVKAVIRRPGSVDVAVSVGGKNADWVALRPDGYYGLRRKVKVH